MDFIEVIGAENKEQNNFMKEYIRKQFGKQSFSIEKARSAALEAYWTSKTYTFGNDEDTFILPE